VREKTAKLEASEAQLREALERAPVTDFDPAKTKVCFETTYPDGLAGRSLLPAEALSARSNCDMHYTKIHRPVKTSRL
jgi:hypothetical protein